MENTLTIKIPNFKLNVFRNLLSQSLMVDNQLMLEFSPEMIKSCSFTQTQTFMKLWTIPLNNLIVTPEKEEGLIEFENLENEAEVALDFPIFNFYILKGDLFKKYISVHNSVEMCDVEFTLHNINNKYCAADMKIIGKTENNSPLITTFVLTTEELISNKIEDYSVILKECSPSKEMLEFVLNDNQMQEVKRLIKQLHKASSDNTAFLTLKIKFSENKIVIKDRVFSLEYTLVDDANNAGKDKEDFEFNILKSDFVRTGNHTFTIFANSSEEKLILGAKYATSIIWCLSSKVKENALDVNDSILDSTIDSMDLSEYGLASMGGDATDDLPF